MRLEYRRALELLENQVNTSNVKLREFSRPDVAVTASWRCPILCVELQAIVFYGFTKVELYTESRLNMTYSYIAHVDISICGTSK